MRETFALTCVVGIVGNALYGLAGKVNAPWLLILARFLCGAGATNAVTSRCVNVELELELEHARGDTYKHTYTLKQTHAQRLPRAGDHAEGSHHGNRRAERDTVPRCVFLCVRERVCVCESVCACERACIP